MLLHQKCYQVIRHLYPKVCRLKPYKDTKWLMPDGNPIGVSVYNCVANQNVPIILAHPKVATWYSCGPTVYDSSHIGHASCYVKLDIIQRVLKHYFKINLITAMGITNIDDKIIKRANEENVHFEVLAKKYEQEFWRDMTSLGVEKPSVITRVSDYVNTIESFVKKLLEEERAYISSDESVYFNVEKYGLYGKLQKPPQVTGISTGHKKTDMDFALWKGAKEGEPFWLTGWGKGRPGWHIECSAMISRIFGSQLDFHAGGIDLQFPHHENEEAQSCAYHNTKQWVNYWIHVGHLQVKGDVKMSKSLKNTVSIQDLLEQYSPETFRMMCLLSHYRNNIEYTDEVMKTALTVLNKFKYFISFCSSHINDHTKESFDSDFLLNKLSQYQETIDNSLQTDFDTPACINALMNLMTDVHKTIDSNQDKHFPVPVALISSYMSDILNCFGINFASNSTENIEYNDILDCLIDFRESVRAKAIETKDKDLFKACDLVRNRLRSLNIQVNDSGDGKSRWIKS